MVWPLEKFLKLIQAYSEYLSQSKKAIKLNEFEMESLPITFSSFVIDISDQILCNKRDIIKKQEINF